MLRRQRRLFTVFANTRTYMRSHTLSPSHPLTSLPSEPPSHCAPLPSEPSYESELLAASEPLPLMEGSDPLFELLFESPVPGSPC